MTETDKSSLDVEPYACAIKKHRYFDAYLIVGHLPRERFLAIVFTTLSITGHVVSTNYKPSPIPAGCSEILSRIDFLSRASKNS